MGYRLLLIHKNTWVDFLTTGELKRIWEPDSCGNHLGKTSATNGLTNPFASMAQVQIQEPSITSRARSTGRSKRRGLTSPRARMTTYSCKAFLAICTLSVTLASLTTLRTKSKLRAVPIDGGDGPISPTPQTINEGTYAPLSRPIYIYINADALDKNQVADFVSFYLDSAGQLAEEVGYISLPQESYQLAKARVDTRTAGSSYHGETPLPKLTETVE